MRFRWLYPLFTVLSLAAAGCSDDATDDSGDTAPDAQSDADVSVDVGPDGLDADPDAEPDVATDASGDTAPDAPDADVAPDATTDPDVDDGLVEIVFEVSVPKTTPAGATVYIAGNFQDWDPGHADYALEAVGDRLYSIALRFEPGTALEFKLTRGAWEQVEKGPSGEEIGNRTHLVAGPATLSLLVASWADFPTGPSTITGDVTQLAVPGFLGGRRVWVYLPPGYDDAPETRYPVLYMLDGQNVFDERTSFAGEWEVDESCEDLIGDGEMAPIIVVAVDNGGADRIAEYTPWPDPGYGGGDAGAHLDAFADTLIPYVDATYRTLTGTENRALAGSSLGGLLSLYAGYAYADTFGLVGALSSSLWWDAEHLTAFVAESAKPDARIYTDMGTRESGSLVDTDDNGVDDSIDRLRALRDELLEQGFVEDDDLLVVEDDGATHSEAFWAARFPDTLRFLFPPAGE